MDDEMRRELEGARTALTEALADLQREMLPGEVPSFGLAEANVLTALSKVNDLLRE